MRSYQSRAVCSSPIDKDGKELKFFQFEKRSNHDLDKIAQEILDRRIDPYLVCIQSKQELLNLPNERKSINEDKEAMPMEL